MLCVPFSLNELLLLFRGCFSQPTFQTFRAMVVGQISQTSLRTVCGMLVGCRLPAVGGLASLPRTPLLQPLQLVGR